MRILVVGAVTAVFSTPIATGVALEPSVGRPAPGPYEGRFIWHGQPAEKLQFKVTPNRRYLTGFRANLQVLCGTEVYINELSFPKTAIGPKGGFNRLWRPIKKDPASTIRLSGHFSGRRMTSGTIKYRVSSCYRDSRMVARHR